MKTNTHPKIYAGPELLACDRCRPIRTASPILLGWHVQVPLRPITYDPS